VSAGGQRRLLRTVRPRHGEGEQTPERPARRLGSARWLRWARVTDPGGLRLRSAGTTTVSVLLAGAVLYPLLGVLGLALPTGLLGVMVAMHSAAAVKDTDHRARVVTTLWAVPCSTGAVVTAGLLQGSGGWGRVGFVTILVIAVWARRFGPRGTALGMVTVMAYFFTLFLEPAPTQILRLVAVVVTGLAATLCVRTLILPDRPRLEIGRLARALRGGCAAVLETAAPGQVRRPVRLRRRLARLAITGVRIGDWLDRNRAAALVSVDSKTFAQRAFEAQISSEELASALWNLPASRVPSTELRDGLAAVDVVLTDQAGPEELRAARSLSVAAMRRADPATAEGVAVRLCRRVVQAHSAVHAIDRRSDGPVRAPRTMRHVEASAGTPPPADPVSADPAPAEPVDSGQETGPQPAQEKTGPLLRAARAPRRWQSSTRLALQVGIAATAAMLIGGVISPDRWYWAVLTAFVVFNGAGNRGEILARGGHRIVGTAIGVPVGVLAALATGDRPWAQLGVMVVCVFFAFYLARVAYLLQTLFITVLVVVLYAMIGGFSTEVLSVRLAETAVGATVGIAAAFAIVSTGTRTEYRDRVDGHLAVMARLIDQAVAAVHTPGVPSPVFATTRELDTALQEVLEAAKPLQLVPASRIRRSVDRQLRWLQNANRSAHALARAGATAARTEAQDGAGAEAAARLSRAAQVVQRDLLRARRAVAGRRPGRPADPAELRAMVTDVQTPGVLRLAVRSLSRIDRAVTALHR